MKVSSYFVSIILCSGLYGCNKLLSDSKPVLGNGTATIYVGISNDGQPNERFGFNFEHDGYGTRFMTTSYGVHNRDFLWKEEGNKLYIQELPFDVGVKPLDPQIFTISWEGDSLIMTGDKRQFRLGIPVIHMIGKEEEIVKDASFAALAGKTFVSWSQKREIRNPGPADNLRDLLGMNRSPLVKYVYSFDDNGRGIYREHFNSESPYMLNDFHIFSENAPMRWRIKEDSLIIEHVKPHSRVDTSKILKRIAWGLSFSEKSMILKNSDERADMTVKFDKVEETPIPVDIKDTMLIPRLEDRKWLSRED